MIRFDATGQSPVDKWTAAPRLTTSPQAQQPQPKRSTHLVHKPVSSECSRQGAARADAAEAVRPSPSWTAICHTRPAKMPGATSLAVRLHGRPSRRGARLLHGERPVDRAGLDAGGAHPETAAPSGALRPVRSTGRRAVIPAYCQHGEREIRLEQRLRTSKTVHSWTWENCNEQKVEVATATYDP